MDRVRVVMCTWCGHPMHDPGCDKTIVVGVTKKKTQLLKPCPCAYRRPESPESV
jgi:hypothetical protein